MPQPHLLQVVQETDGVCTLPLATSAELRVEFDPSGGTGTLRNHLRVTLSDGSLLCIPLTPEARRQLEESCAGDAPSLGPRPRGS